MKTLLDLYFTFFKIGATTFGGGYGMLPMIEKIVIEQKHWTDIETVTDYYAVGSCTPGIIAINIATFIGYGLAGIAGGITATMGVISPSIIIISLIAGFINNFAHLAIVRSALNGISAGVCAIVINSVIKMCKGTVKDIFGIILCVLGFLITFFTDIPVVMTVTGSAVCGIVRMLYKRNRS